MQHFSIFGNKMLSENFTMKCALFQNPFCLFLFFFLFHFIFVQFVCFVENFLPLRAGFRNKVGIHVTDFFNEVSIHTPQKKKGFIQFELILLKMLIFLGELTWRKYKVSVTSLAVVADPPHSLDGCEAQVVIVKANWNIHSENMK